MASSESPTPSNEQSESSSPAPKAWRRRLLITALIALGLFVAFIGFAVFYLRFVPKTLEQSQRGPEALRQPRKDGLRLRWLGVTGYEITDGQTTLITDPAMTRPQALSLVTQKVKPDEPQSKKWVPKADFILINHSHYDHIVDMPEIALRTKALVVGSQSTCNLAVSRGVPKSQTKVVKGGDQFKLGSFEIQVISGRHTAILGQSNPMPGVIPEDAKKSLWFWQYTQDGVLQYHIKGGGTSLWFHPAITHKDGQMRSLKAENIIVGINGEPIGPGKMEPMILESGAKRMIPTHFDNFFQPLSKGLCIMPSIDLDEVRTHMMNGKKDRQWIVLDYNETIYLPPDSKK